MRRLLKWVIRSRPHWKCRTRPGSALIGNESRGARYWGYRRVYLPGLGEVPILIVWRVRVADPYSQPRGIPQARD